MTSARSPLPRETLLAIVRIVLLYALFAALWILLSDALVARIFPSPANLQVAGTLKGLVFVAVTAVLLFLLILRFAQGRAATDAPKVGAGATAPPTARRTLATSLALLSLVFALLGAAGLQQTWNFHRDHQAQQLRAVAQLKARQLESWLDERYRDAEVIRSAPLFRESLPRWRASGEAREHDRLLARLRSFREIMGYRDVALVDGDGRLLLSAAGEWHHGESETLTATIRNAIAQERTLTTDFFRMETPPPPHVHLDFVTPVPGVAAAIVLHIDVENTLFPFLAEWPLPSASAETVLFRRDGDALVFINQPRHRPGAALVERIALDADNVLSARVMRPDYLPDALLEGNDYRGQPALAVARPIEGTAWWLMAKVDRAEALAESRRDSVWILIASLTTWLVTVALAVLFFLRRELQIAQGAAAEKEEKLRALQLLKAIADNSQDAIFAKDRAGRYLLANPASCALIGQPEAAVLGRDDTALLRADLAAAVQEMDRRIMAEERTVSIEETLDLSGGRFTLLTVKGPLYDAAGRVAGVFGISRDITARARAESELRAKNEELERFNRAMVGRELDMLRLKREINQLNAELGRPPPHALYAVEEAPEEMEKRP